MSIPIKFCFIPLQCGVCGKSLVLETNRIKEYESHGYPMFCKKHTSHHPNNWMKSRGKKIMSERMKLHNPMHNPVSYQKRYKKELNIKPKSRLSNCINCAKFSKAGRCAHFFVKITVPVDDCEFYKNFKEEISDFKEKQRMHFIKINEEKHLEDEIRKQKEAKDKEYIEKLNTGEEKRIFVRRDKTVVEKRINNIVLPSVDPRVQPVPEIVPNQVIEAPIMASVEVPMSLQVPSVVSPMSVSVEPEPIQDPKISTISDIFAKLEAQRQAKIEQYKLEEAKRLPEPTPRLNIFGRILCLKEGKYIKCKKPKAFCSQWEFCHNKAR